MLRLYTIEYKSGYIGPTSLNWTTKKDILNYWNPQSKDYLKIVTKLINPADYANERGGVHMAFLMTPAIEAIKKACNL